LAQTEKKIVVGPMDFFTARSSKKAAPPQTGTSGKTSNGHGPATVDSTPDVDKPPSSVGSFPVRVRGRRHLSRAAQTSKKYTIAPVGLQASFEYNMPPSLDYDATYPFAVAATIDTLPDARIESDPDSEVDNNALDWPRDEVKPVTTLNLVSQS
jgi:hypothetical protein